MSPAELSAYCAAPSVLSVAGTVALMTIGALSAASSLLPWPRSGGASESSYR